MINVTKPNLPPIEEYIKYLQDIWDECYLTNQGPMVNKLENHLKNYLKIDYIQFVTNGTIALQLAFEALQLHGEVITTPFSHVAGLNAIIKAGCKPVFVDIERTSYCLDAGKLEEFITAKTSAILATHVYGFPCDVAAIEKIAKKYNLKVIYDGAQAFGTKINDETIFNWGDVAIVSFHATKIFHTVEGGGIFTRNEELDKKIKSLKIFGLEGQVPTKVGINGKNSELHAAMGLCNLPAVDESIEKRKTISLLYKAFLNELPLDLPSHSANVRYNYAYFPVVFPSVAEMKEVKELLNRNEIFPRRYFFPSLNKSLFLKEANSCPIAESISERVICLPLYDSLSAQDVERIANKIAEYYS